MKSTDLNFTVKRKNCRLIKKFMSTNMFTKAKIYDII